MDGRVAVGRVFGQSLSYDRCKRIFDIVDLGCDSHMFHQYLSRAGADERDFSGQHLVQQYAKCVDVNAAVIAAGPDFRCHIVHGSNGNRMAAVTTGTYGFGESIVTDLHVTVFVKDVTGLKVTMDNATFMQEGQTLGDFTQEESCFLRSEAVR